MTINVPSRGKHLANEKTLLDKDFLDGTLIKGALGDLRKYSSGYALV